MRILQALHRNLIALEDTSDLFYFFDGDFKVVSLLEDECQQLNIRELLVKGLEELLRLLNDLVSEIDQTVTHL